MVCKVRNGTATTFFYIASPPCLVCCLLQLLKRSLRHLTVKWVTSSFIPAWLQIGSRRREPHREVVGRLHYGCIYIGIIYTALEWEVFRERLYALRGLCVGGCNSCDNERSQLWWVSKQTPGGEWVSPHARQWEDRLMGSSIAWPRDQGLGPLICGSSSCALWQAKAGSVVGFSSRNGV